MKRAFTAFALSIFLAAPAIAQPPSGKTDWTKPVVGVDSGIPYKPSITEDVARPIEITVIDLKASTSQALPAADNSPLPPPCEPPATKAPATVKPPPPAPCPAPPR